MKLNKEQEAAVTYLGGPLLVLAGPGTGKTQLLGQKVAYILQNTDTNPENILCLTFTETGAKNMRERLKTIIGHDALKVVIGTYHAFGAEILAEYKNYDENYNRRLDAAIDEVMQFKIVRDLQSALPGDDILRGDPVKDIISVISEAKKARLAPGDLERIALQNIDDSVAISEMASPLLAQVVRGKLAGSLENAYLPILDELTEMATARQLLPTVERTAAILKAGLCEAVEAAREANSVAPLTKWKNDNFEQDDKGNYRLKDRIANKKLLSLAKMMRSYEEYLYDHALFDYDDMIEEAAKALRDNDGFRMTLQERYQFIMLDEFQDTNPSQLAIVKELTDYENPIIMAVGDDDQTIYEFQGALASNLTDFKAHYDAKVINMVENYRSTQEILDFSTKIIEQANDRFADKHLHANKPTGAETKIHRLEFLSADAEYGFVAEKIADLVRSGVPQDQIAVISRKNKYFEPLLPYLKAHDEIKIAYDKRDNLFVDEKIHALIITLKYAYEVASNRKPTVQILEVLSQKFLGLSALELVKLSGAARDAHEPVFSHMSKNGSDDLKATLEFLAQLAADSLTMPFETLEFRVVEKINQTITDSYEQFRFYENLASLKGKLQNHFGEKRLMLVDFVEMLNDYEAAEMPLTATSPYRDADSAVQLMTVHGAKGLEFEYVFLIAVDNRSWGKAKGNNNFLSLPKNLAHIRHTGITDSERLRVMYVALTRAKSELYLTNAVQDFTGKKVDRLEYFDEHESADGSRVVAPFLPSGQVETVVDARPLEVLAQNVKDWVFTSFVEQPDVKNLLRERMRNFKMSASALTDFVDIVSGGPQSFFERYVMRAPQGPDNEALVLGNLMHAVLEEVTRNGLSDAEAMEFYEKQLEAYDTTDEIREAVRARGLKNLAKTLERFGQMVRSGKAEVKFSGENIVFDGVPITGKIDHILIDRAAKSIEIFDYKTGKYRESGWTSHPTLLKYMLQLIFYKVLIKNSREYRDYAVKSAHILFVSCDDDGEVRDREYIFNAKDDELFGQALKAVYKQATTLGFVDDPELFIKPDKNNSAKKMREFMDRVVEKSVGGSQGVRA